MSAARRAIRRHRQAAELASVSTPFLAMTDDELRVATLSASVTITHPAIRTWLDREIRLRRVTLDSAGVE